EQTVNEQLEAKVITRSSNSSKTSYAVVVDLSEMELKKILIEKIEGKKSIHRSNKQRNLYKALVEAYESDKIILDPYGDTTHEEEPLRLELKHSSESIVISFFTIITIIIIIITFFISEILRDFFLRLISGYIGDPWLLLVDSLSCCASVIATSKRADRLLALEVVAGYLPLVEVDSLGPAAVVGGGVIVVLELLLVFQTLALVLGGVAPVATA
nr:hypothetical protein [Tanacetum cinerariifolium]